MDDFGRTTHSTGTRRKIPAPHRENTKNTVRKFSPRFSTVPIASAYVSAGMSKPEKSHLSMAASLRIHLRHLPDMVAPRASKI
jgi:hypothetical protein